MLKSLNLKDKGCKAWSIIDLRAIFFSFAWWNYCITRTRHFLYNRRWWNSSEIGILPGNKHNIKIENTGSLMLPSSVGWCMVYIFFSTICTSRLEELCLLHCKTDTVLTSLSNCFCHQFRQWKFWVWVWHLWPIIL
jgi:hypothetical protein